METISIMCHIKTSSQFILFILKIHNAFIYDPNNMFHSALEFLFFLLIQLKLCSINNTYAQKLTFMVMNCSTLWHLHILFIFDFKVMMTLIDIYNIIYI